MSELSTRTIDLSDQGLNGIVGLMRSVFPHATHLNHDYLHWQYVQNPNGTAVGANVYDGDLLVAHFVLQPVYAESHGEGEKGLVVLNIATHPDYRGRGLFAIAGRHAMKEAKRQGYGHVVGLPNQYSTGGFVKHLAYNLVGPLDVKIGFGAIPHAGDVKDLSYQMQWSPEALDWRLKRPGNRYIQKVTSKGIEVYSPTGRWPLPMALIGTTQSELNLPRSQLRCHPFKLWMGFDVSRHWKKSCYFELPVSKRPSPLNFVYYDLTEQGRALTKEQIVCSTLDFDLY